MTLAFSALYALTLLASATLAQDVEEVKHQFEPTTIKAPFLEQFGSDWQTKWYSSAAIKVEKGTDNDPSLQYNGVWSVEGPKTELINGDLGLVLKTPAAHHAIAAKFDAPIDAQDKSLVVQYEVAAQNDLECGGAYMKLLTSNSTFDPKEFDNKAGYSIMFGPDKCGATNRVHFIFRHKNPLTNEWQEKHLRNPPAIKSGTKHNLYTLVVNPDQSFEMLINNESAKKGSLLEDFDPPVNPPKEVEDTNDKKPSNWVEEAEMDDPNAKKPDDWDETQPPQIVDEAAVKPADWQDDEPPSIPDPESIKPNDWDDEEDGDWIAPSIANPKCQGAVGCGEWQKPQIPNPEYKGIWTAPKIPNPEYKGQWKPRKIANPGYFEDLKPSQFAPMGAIGFELWTLQSDILFDNIYIGHSHDDAKELAKQTWVLKQDKEKASAPQTPPSAESVGKADGSTSLIDNLISEFSQFVEGTLIDPVETIKQLPHIAGGLALAIVLPFLFLFSGSSKRSAQRKLEATAEAISSKIAEVEPVATEIKEKAKESIDNAAKTIKKRVGTSEKNSDDD